MLCDVFEVPGDVHRQKYEGRRKGREEGGGKKKDRTPLHRRLPPPDPYSRGIKKRRKGGRGERESTITLLTLILSTAYVKRKS